MNRNKLNIIGAGGHAKVVVEIAEIHNYELTIFDRDENITSLFDYPIHRDYRHIQDEYVIAVGDNRTRKKIAQELHLPSPNLKHPSAVISSRVKIGMGNVFMAGTIVNSSTQIGNHCIINTTASIDHDCIIDDYVHISPGAKLAGGVQVGEGTQVGLGACVKQNVKIGKWCVIGMGAVVIHDIEDYSIVVGNPAIFIKKNVLPSLI